MRGPGPNYSSYFRPEKSGGMAEKIKKSRDNTFEQLLLRTRLK
jgi:hypothetical protein